MIPKRFSFRFGRRDFSVADSESARREIQLCHSPLSVGSLTLLEFDPPRNPLRYPFAVRMIRRCAPHTRPRPPACRIACRFPGMSPQSLSPRIRSRLLCPFPFPFPLLTCSPHSPCVLMSIVRLHSRLFRNGDVHAGTTTLILARVAARGLLASKESHRWSFPKLL